MSRPGRGVGTACLATPSSSLKAADRRQHQPSHPAPASPEALWAQRWPYPVLPQFFPGCDGHLDLCSAPVSWVQFSSPSHLAHRVGLGLGQGQVPARGKGKALHFSWRVRLGLEPGRCQAREASCSPENWGWGGRCRGACRNLGSQAAACRDFRSMALCTRRQEQRKAPAWCPSCRRKKRHRNQGRHPISCWGAPPTSCPPTPSLASGTRVTVTPLIQGLPYRALIISHGVLPLGDRSFAAPALQRG